jgi:hypothetical protein
MVEQHILPYFTKNAPIYGYLWMSSSIHHISLERKIKVSRSGGPHKASRMCSLTTAGRLGYNKN